jgi:hypothetical protein
MNGDVRGGGGRRQQCQCRGLALASGRDGGVGVVADGDSNVRGIGSGRRRGG